MMLRELLMVCAWAETMTDQELQAFRQFAHRAITEGYVRGIDRVVIVPDGQGGYDVLLPERAAP